VADLFEVADHAASILPRKAGLVDGG
jgi:hypothetical protein